MKDKYILFYQRRYILKLTKDVILASQICFDFSYPLMKVIWLAFSCDV